MGQPTEDPTENINEATNKVQIYKMNLHILLREIKEIKKLWWIQMRSIDSGGSAGSGGSEDSGKINVIPKPLNMVWLDHPLIFLQIIKY